MRGRVRDPKLSLSNRRGKTLWPALVLAGAFALGLAIPALAAYLGPDRDYTVTVTESETVRDYDNDSWTLTGPEGVCIIIHSCDEHPGTSNYIPACGWSGPADNASCTPAFKTIQVTRTETHYYPEATVSGAIQCAQNGANGWCLGSGSIELSANEPLGSYSILGIEGSLDGNNFFCSGTSCSVPGSPGSAEANYWALSSYGDSSSSGSQTLKIDNDLPTIAGLVSGVQGNGGWYVGTIGLTAVGADATSGLAAQQVQVDGGGWQDTSATISSDGSYSVVFRAVDEAGQESYTAAQSLGRDSAAPTISLNMYDAPARGSALVAGAASDATSGVVAVHFLLNGSLNQTITTSGGAWQLHWDSTEVPNGDYTIQVYAEDQAGHYSAPVQVSVQVDNAVPYINLSSGCWPIWQALDLDAGPGAAPISLVSLTVSNGSQSLTEIFSTPPQGWVWNRTFSDGSVAPIGDYGLQVYVEDASGNSSSRTACISIPEPDAVGLSTEDGGAQASPLQSFVPSNETDTPPPSASFANAQLSVSVITALQPQPAFVQQLQQATPANAAVWGPAALTLAAAATAIAMAEKNRREEEERRRNEPDPFATHPNNLLAAHLSDKEVMAQVLAAGAEPNISIEQARLITHNALKGKGAYSPTGGELNEQARQAANETNVGGGANNLLAAHLSDKEVMAQVLAAGADPNISIEQARLITHNALKGKGAYSPTGGELNEQARQAANETTIGGGAYSVQAGDNWFSIAEKIYGNQRMAGQLIDANGGVSMLQPGQTIALPQVSGSEAASPNFNPKTWDEVAKFTLVQEVLKKAEEDEEQSMAKGGQQRPALHPNFPEGPAGLELALRMLANGTLTPEGFLAAFPHVDLANAIYAANSGQLSAATIEWLWRENVYSQVALQQKQDDMAALHKGLIDFQARDINEAELLAMFPHLPINQALALVNNPEGLYNLWMTHAGKAWVQDLEERRAAETRQTSYEAWREGELDFTYNEEVFENEATDIIELLRRLSDATDLYDQAKIVYNDLGTGHFSVSTRFVNEGARLYTRQQAGIPGTYYRLSNLQSVGNTALQTSMKHSLVFGAILDIGSNIYSYGWGENKEIGLNSNEFRISASIDVVSTVAISVAAVLFVSALGFTSAPLFVAGAITMGAAYILEELFSPLIESGKQFLIEHYND